MVSSWITPKAHKGVRSDIAGRGLFAVEPISADEIVAVKGGHIVTTPQLADFPTRCPTRGFRSPTSCTLSRCRRTSTNR